MLVSIQVCMTALFKVESFVEPVRLSLMSVILTLGPLYAYLAETQKDEPTDAQINAIANALTAAKTAAEGANDERSAEIIHMCLVIVEAYLNR